MAHPPLRTIAPARHGRVAGLGEVFLPRSARDLVHHRCRNDPLPVELATIAHHLADPGQIAQAEVHAAATRRHPDRIDDDVRVFLHAHLPPDALGDQLRHRLARYALHDPREHFGVAGLVRKRRPMLTLLLQRREKVNDRARPVIPLRRLSIPCSDAIGPHLCFGIDIVLRIFDADRHIHDLPHARIRKRRPRQLRHIRHSWR